MNYGTVEALAWRFPFQFVGHIDIPRQMPPFSFTKFGVEMKTLFSQWTKEKKEKNEKTR